MKYDVFERLNTGGSELTPQEVRNCIFRATNPEFVEWVDELARFGPFQFAYRIFKKRLSLIADSYCVTSR